MRKNQRFLISADVLQKLYWEDGLSILQIAQKLKCAGRTIHTRMQECKIPLRKPGSAVVNVNKKELHNLYIVQKFSSRKIAILYHCAYSTIDRKIRQCGFPIKTLAAAHITTPRQDFSDNELEKAYLIGFRIGDLRVRRKYKNSETIAIDCASTKINQIVLIKSLFRKYGRVWISKPTKTGKIQIECGVNNSFSFLLPKFDKFPNWTFVKNKSFFSLLAGFIDAEGSFFVTKNGDASAFSVGNYNQVLLQQLQNQLMKWQIRSRMFISVRKGYTGKDGYSHNADYWILSITHKASLYRFITIILPYLKHKDRIKAAQLVISNIDKRNELYGNINMPSPMVINAYA